MTSLADTIAATLAEHVLSSGFDDLGAWQKYLCGCGWPGNSDGHHRAHIAAILAEQEAQRTAEAVDRERVRHGHVARGGAL